MAISDTIADYLTGIRNAYMANKETVTLPSSKVKVRIAEILQEEGYIQSFNVVDEGVKKFIHIRLRYLNSGKPAILNIQRVSKPGLRKFVDSKKVPRVRSGLGTMVVSTSKGIMSDAAARKEQIGGELIFKVW